MAADPPFTFVLTTSLDPALKLASNPQQSPTTFHSTAFQCCDNSSMLSVVGGAAIAAASAVVSETVSPLPVAIAVSVVSCSCAADTWGTIVELLLQNQLTSSLGIHGVAQLAGGVVGLIGP